MATDRGLDPELLLQPIETGATIPENIPSAGLFLLNLSSFMRDDVWDDYGNKELDQAGRLRNFSSRITAIANAMEELGTALKSYPDADDYEIDEYDQPWDELMSEMNESFDEGYKSIAALVESMADEAIGDFME